MEIKLGDYIIGRDSIIYRIVNINSDITYTFDIKSINCNITEINDNDYGWFSSPIYIQGLTHSQLRHLGELVPENKFSKAMQILYV